MVTKCCISFVCATVTVIPLTQSQKIGHIGTNANFGFPYLQFPSLFTLYDVSKCEIRYRWAQGDYIPRLQISFVWLISKGTVQKKNEDGNTRLLALWRVCEKNLISSQSQSHSGDEALHMSPSFISVTESTLIHKVRNYAKMMTPHTPTFVH